MTRIPPVASSNASGRPSGPELDFERPLLALERQIAELEDRNEQARQVGSAAGAAGGAATATATTVDLGTEIRKLRRSHAAMLEKTYANLDPADVVKVARHPARPQTRDYLRAFVRDFCEIHGDRHFGDDRAIITGFGRIGQHKTVIVGHHKGVDTQDKIACNFGCAHPEGYRKALRAMKLAEKYGLPLITFVDTPGAYPGIGAEQRGQAEAIALNLREMSRLRTPIISVIIGEGGSGGALGIGVADRVAMMQYAWYSVISPEGCAAILWKQANPENNAAAARALKLTASANLQLGTIDEVIDEPLGGAHRDPATACSSVEKFIVQQLRELKRFKITNLVNKRYKRLRSIGAYDA